jgi:hypothetical protein
VLTFELSKQYKGIGISHGLDRGLLVYQNSELLIDEGMGLGAVAVQLNGINYFASIRKMNQSFDQIEVILSVDKMLSNSIYGIRSKRLTRIYETVFIKSYKEHERSQRIWFKIGGWFNSLLKLKASFIQVPTKGQFVLTYQISEDEIRISVSAALEETVDKIYVMNELSGMLFDQGIVDGQVEEPPSGWQHAEEEYQLYSGVKGVSFAAQETNRPKNLKSQLFWGRETGEYNCWAGFIYELQCEDREFNDFRYAISFREGV